MTGSHAFPILVTCVWFALHRPVVEFLIILSLDFNFLEVRVIPEKLVAEFFHKNILFVDCFIHQISLLIIVNDLILPFLFPVCVGLQGFVSQIDNVPNFIKAWQVDAFIWGFLLWLRYSIDIGRILLNQRFKHGDQNHFHESLIQSLRKHFIKIKHLVQDLFFVLNHEERNA